MTLRTILVSSLLICLAACGDLNSDAGSGTTNGELAQVTRVIDGDTIDVRMNGETWRVRYIGINTPERDEPCYAEASAANEALVEGQAVRLVKDVSETDPFDRLLRYVYVGDTFVNLELVRDGYAEATLYQPDERFYDEFLDAEQSVENSDIGCHATGIFDDGTYTR